MMPIAHDFFNITVVVLIHFYHILVLTLLDYLKVLQT